MTPEDIRKEVMTTLCASWATKTLIEISNQRFTAPSSSAWIRPTIKLGSAFIGELGTDGIGLRTGVVMVSVFVPPGTGLKTANEYAAALETIFRRAEMNGVIFDEASTEDLGVDQDNGFYHLMVSCNLNAWVGEE